MYMYCKDLDYFPCACLCPDGKLFNRLLNKCAHADVAYTSATTDADTKDLRSLRGSKSYTKSSYFGDENRILKTNSTKVPLRVETFEVDIGESHLLANSQQLKHTSSSSSSTILQDDMVFPAWAIALVVLCVVILFMLVILILY